MMAFEMWCLYCFLSYFFDAKIKLSGLLADDIFMNENDDFSFKQRRKRLYCLENDLKQLIFVKLLFLINKKVQFLIFIFNGQENCSCNRYG